MRIFTTNYEAIREVERDHWEMGIEVKTHSMQDKVIEGNEDFFTKELSPCMFQVTKPVEDMDELLKFYHDSPGLSEELAQFYAEGLDLRWAQEEFKDRVAEVYLNPGTSWEIRSDTWKEFMHDGKFAYTYNQRIRMQLSIILEELKNHPGTRQAIIEVHNGIMDINSMGGKSRVPCSMHYQILIRNEKVDLIYIMRSSDFLTHFGYDNWLAIRLQKHIANQLNREVGRYTYVSGSLHAYYKDMKTRGIF